MRRLVRVGLCLALLFLLAAVLGAPASGQGDLNHAGVVIRHADGEVTYAYVAFPEEQLNGIDLLRRTGVDLVTVSFGGLGEGVCSIDEHGCPAADCRQRVCQGPRADDPFWKYFRQGAPGDWQALALGASGTKVRDGDLDGWSWSGTEAFLPALSLADVARLAGVPAGDETASSGTVMRRVGAAERGSRTDDLATVVVAGGVVAIAGGAVVVLAVRRRTESAG